MTLKFYDDKKFNAIGVSFILFSELYFFVLLVKRVPGWGQEQRESDKTVLYLLIIIIILISHIII
jgi:hypothetical protein